MAALQFHPHGNPLGILRQPSRKQPLKQKKHVFRSYIALTLHPYNIRLLELNSSVAEMTSHFKLFIPLILQ